MARLSSELLLTLRDGVSGPARKVGASLGDMDRRLDDAERNLVRRQRMQTNAAAGIGRASGSAMAAIGGVLAPAALAYGAKQAYVTYAGVERDINRIGITAGATAEETKAAFGAINKAASDYATTQAEVTEGLNTLVSAGRSLSEAMAFLPSVVATAQASGSAITDIASTADSVGRNFGIAGDKMQGAFDVMVAGGKAGMFELKDMASYLPSLAPAFAALGYKGEEGLQKLIASLQVLRTGAGTAGEAATNMGNILAKIESEETANKFKKMGVDLRKEMKKARAEGRDLIDFFVELTEATVKGDLSKLPLLFGDMQMLSGMRTLINGGDELAEVLRKLGSAAGSTKKDLDRILGDSQARIDKMSSSWTKLMTNVGAGVARFANPAMDEVNTRMEAGAAYRAGLKRNRADGGSEAEIQDEFNRRYGQAHPDFSAWNPNDRRARNEAFVKNVGEYGSGKAETPFGSIDEEIAALKRLQQARMTASQAYAISGLDAAPRLDNQPVRHEGVPKPSPRGSSAAMSEADQRESYGRGRLAAERTMQSMSPRDAVQTESIQRIEAVQARIEAAILGKPLPSATPAAAAPSAPAAPAPASAPAAPAPASAPVPAPTWTSAAAPAAPPPPSEKGGRGDLGRSTGAIAIPTPKPDIVGPVTAEGEAAALKAQEIGGRISDAFSVTATAKVKMDDGEIDASQRKLERLLSTLARVGPAARSAAESANAAVRSAFSPRHRLVASKERTGHFR